MSGSAILVTGADGYVGSRLARRLLAVSHRPILAWVHASDAAALESKRAQVEALGGAGSPRVEVHGGDLARDDAFASVSARAVGAFVHAAAVTRFNVERDVAERVNVGGSRRAMSFARGCPSLESFLLVSSVHAAGLRVGTVPERRLDGAAGFANHYEWSKWASEEALLDDFDALPWRIARVATIIADDDTGVVSQQNSFHNSLKLLFFGLLSILPGDPRVRPSFVTGDFVTDALEATLLGAPVRSVVHVAHGLDESASLGDLVALAFEAFREDPEFRARRIMEPLFCDAEAFDLLVQGVNDSGGAILRQALASMAPFARQLYLEKDVSNATLRDVLPSYAPPDAKALLRNTCRHLVATRWGRSAAVARSVGA